MWRRAIYAAIDAGKPEGHAVRHRGRDRGDLVITFVPDDRVVTKVRPRALKVPEGLEGLHPILRATKKAAGRRGKGWISTFGQPGVLHLDVDAPNLGRTLRMAQAVVTEAEARGHRVEVPEDGKSGGLCIGIGRQRVELAFWEDRRRVEVRTNRGSYYYRTDYRYEPKGQVEAHAGAPGYGTRLAADRKRWTLEDRLADVLARVEELAAEAEAGQAAQERKAIERRQAWEAAMARARLLLVESSRVEALDAQLAGWHRAGDIRAFAAAAAALEDPTSDPDRAAWLEWVGSYADSLDPTGAAMAIPPAPEATESSLQPFLGRWSAYGPESMWGSRWP